MIATTLMIVCRRAGKDDNKKGLIVVVLQKRRNGNQGSLNTWKGVPRARTSNIVTTHTYFSARLFLFSSLVYTDFQTVNMLRGL